MLGESIVIVQDLLIWTVLSFILLAILSGAIHHFASNKEGFIAITQGPQKSLAVKAGVFVMLVIASFIISFIFIDSTIDRKKSDLEQSLSEATVLKHVGSMLDRPLDEQSLTSWFSGKIYGAFRNGASVNEHASTQTQFIEVVLPGNADSKEKVTAASTMMQTVALSTLLSPNCDDLVSTLFASMIAFNGETPFDDSINYATRCPKNIDENSREVDALKMFITEQLSPKEVDLASLWFEELLVPNPTTIRLKILSGVENPNQIEIFSKNYTNSIKNREANTSPTQAVNILESLINMMIVSTELDLRAIAIVWGPIQHLTLMLYFVGILVLAIKQGRLVSCIISKRRVYSSDSSSRVDYVLWALPTLGFIGTVTGISAAIADAYKVSNASDPAAQADAIKTVTAQLGVAFDTTFIALICTLPLTAFFYVIRAQILMGLASQKDD